MSEMDYTTRNGFHLHLVVGEGNEPRYAITCCEEDWSSRVYIFGHDQLKDDFHLDFGIPELAEEAHLEGEKAFLELVQEGISDLERYLDQGEKAGDFTVFPPPQP